MGGSGGGQALDAKRTPAFSFEPNQLVIIDKPGDPLYQRDRNELPVSREQVLAIALGPPASSIRVRRLEDGTAAVAAGRQRVKSAAVANAIGCGIAYTGKLASVKAAIAEYKKDADFVQHVTTLMRGRPRCLTAQAANDSIANVRGMIATENALAQVESKRAVIQGIQEDVREFEIPVAIVAARRGLKVSTVKRYLKVDLGKPIEKPKTRGKSTRPSAKRILAVVAKMEEAAVTDGINAMIDALRWAAGDTSEEDFFEDHGEFKPAAKKKEAA